MPEISRFFGILIKMQYSDHNPPHIHAEYGEFEASFDFEGNVIDGNLPPKQTKYVSAWVVMHEEELVANWGLAKKKADLINIIPLRRD